MDVKPEIIRTNALAEMLGISRVTLWRRVRDGEMPRPFRLGGPCTKAVGWKRGEIEAWLEGLRRTKGNGATAA